MALKGELTDLSLAELIEFFCNQRKTGRLTVSYPQAPAYFYLQSGSVVHASVGSLRGIEAVFYALTQSNASFNFSAAYEAPAQTINQPWTSVVLEGLRRMDEGITPRNPFSEKSEAVVEETSAKVSEAAVVLPLAAPSIIESKDEQMDEAVEPPPIVQPEPIAPVQAAEQPPAIHARSSETFVKQDEPVKHREEIAIEKHKQPIQRPPVSDAFLSSAQSPSKFSYAPWKLAAVFAALVLIIAGIAVPWGWHVRGKAAKAAEQPQVMAEQAQSPVTENSQAATSEVPSSQSPDEAGAPHANDAADAARREREARAREEAKQKAKAAEANANPTTAQTSTPASTQASAAGPKKAVVTVTYDENGRVTQASGNDPTALRIARQKRFPPGKAGSATLTIPIN